MTGVSWPLAIKGLTFSPKAAPLMAVSSAIALGDSWCKGKNAYLGEIAVLSSAHKPPGDVLSGSTLFSLRVLRSLHQQP